MEQARRLAHHLYTQNLRDCKHDQLPQMTLKSYHPNTNRLTIPNIISTRAECKNRMSTFTWTPKFVSSERAFAETYIPGAEGKGRSDGIEPPWKSFNVITARGIFFFDILVPWLPVRDSMPPLPRRSGTFNGGPQERSRKLTPERQQQEWQICTRIYLERKLWCSRNCRNLSYSTGF